VHLRADETVQVAAATPVRPFGPPATASDVDVALLPWFAVPRTASVVNPRPPVPPPEQPPSPPPARVAAVPDFSPAALGPWLTGAYAVAAGLLLARWLVGHVALRRLLRSAWPAPAEVVRLFETMTRGRLRPRLLVSGRLRVPVSCGLLRPTVLVPATLCKPAAREALRWVFAHELTHLERRDAWACLLFGLGQVVYFILPWFWWLRRQVRLCQEYVADAAAAEQAAHVEDYAQFLLCLTAAPAPAVPATGVVGNSSDLFRRVTMLLEDPLRVERRCPSWLSCGAAGALLALAVCVSGLGLTAATPVRADDEIRIELADPPAKKEVRKVETVRKEQKADKAEKAEKAAKAKKAEKPDFVAEIEALLEALPQAADREEVRAEIKKAIEHIHKAIKEGAFERVRVFRDVDEDVKERVKEAEKRVKEAMKAREEGLQGRLATSQAGGVRLGVTAERPGQVLADQLDLPKGQGLVIEDVQPNSPAARAGLKPHDILLEIGGKPVPSNVQDLVKLLAEHKPGEAFDVLVLRKGKKETIKGVKLGEGRASQRIQSKQAEGKIQSKPAEGKLQSQPREGAKSGAFAAAEAQAGDGRRTVMTTTFRTDDRFTTRHQEGSLIITVTGKAGEGKAKVEEIQVQDGDRTNKYNSVNRVPQQYRDKVKNLIDMAEKSNIKIEIKSGTKGKKQDDQDN
jgi:beta-lactamase regulating signal transducer with metallopeptidase domain